MTVVDDILFSGTELLLDDGAQTLHEQDALTRKLVYEQSLARDCTKDASTQARDNVARVYIHRPFEKL